MVLVTFRAFFFFAAMQFNRQKFFDGFRDRIDPTIEQEQVDGLEFLLGEFERDPAWTDIRHIAYALATVFHETASSFQPVEEGYYLGEAAAKRHQRKLRYYPYYGRGYVQLTWKSNYEVAGKAFGVDLVNNPNRAMEPEIAYKSLTVGLMRGWYGSKLTAHINARETDYVNARRCVNKLDKAGLIAGYARSFEKILKDSATTTDSGDTPTPTPADNAFGAQPTNNLLDANSSSPTNIPAGDPPPSDIPVIEQPTVTSTVQETSVLTKIDEAGNKVQQVSTTFDKFSLPTMPSGLGTKLQVFGKWIWALILMILGFFWNHPEYIILAVVLVSVAAWLWNRSRERNNPVGAGAVPVATDKKWWQFWRTSVAAEAPKTVEAPKDSSAA